MASQNNLDGAAGHLYYDGTGQPPSHVWLVRLTAYGARQMASEREAYRCAYTKDGDNYWSHINDAKMFRILAEAERQLDEGDVVGACQTLEHSRGNGVNVPRSDLEYIALRRCWIKMQQKK